MSLSVSIPVECVEALSAAASSDEVIAICAKWLPAALRSDRVSLSIDVNGVLVIGALSEDGVGVSGEALDRRWSLSDKVMASKEVTMVCAPDAQGSRIIQKLFERGYRTAMLVPMISNGVVTGTLNLSSRRANAYDASDIRRCKAVGAWIGSQLLIRQYAEKMERLAMVDPMTGHPNRRSFMVTASAGMEAYLAGGSGFAVVLFDLDHFKRVNDRHGHELGDTVLKRSAAVVAGLLGGDDVLGRIGGEEFALFLPGATLDMAVGLADRCRAALCEAALVSAGDGSRIGISASFGCAVAQPGDEAIDDVLRRADGALYAAKAAGRNRVRHAA